MKKIISTLLLLLLCGNAFAWSKNEMYCHDGKCALFKEIGSDKLILPLEYDDIVSLYENEFAKALKDGKWELFKTKGKVKKVLNESYDEIYYFYLGSFFVRNGDKTYIYNSKKKTLELLDYNIVSYLGPERYFAVKEGNKITAYQMNYVYNKKEKRDYSYYQKHGISKADLKLEQDSSRKYNPNEKGIIYSNVDIAEKPKENLEFKKGTIVKNGNKYGFQNNKAEVKLEPVYDKIYGSKEFADNYLLVKKGDKYAVYQINKNKLSDFKYDMAYISTNGPVVTYQGAKKVYYNKRIRYTIAAMAVPTVAICLPSCVAFAAAWPVFLTVQPLGDLILAPVTFVETLFPKTPSRKQFPD